MKTEVKTALNWLLVAASAVFMAVITMLTIFAISIELESKLP